MLEAYIEPSEWLWLADLCWWHHIADSKTTPLLLFLHLTSVFLSPPPKQIPLPRFPWKEGNPEHFCSEQKTTPLIFFFRLRCMQEGCVWPSRSTASVNFFLIWCRQSELIRWWGKPWEIWQGGLQVTLTLLDLHSLVTGPGNCWQKNQQQLVKGEVMIEQLFLALLCAHPWEPSFSAILWEPEQSIHVSDIWSKFCKVDECLIGGFRVLGFEHFSLLKACRRLQF